MGRTSKTFGLACVGASLVVVAFAAPEYGPVSAQACGDPGARSLAIRTIRSINSSESDAFALSHAYKPLQYDQGDQTVSLAVEPDRYAVMVLVNAESCRIALFSNQDGIIYEGQALK